MEEKKPEEKPSLKAMQLLGVMAAVGEDWQGRSNKGVVPDGFECTACHERQHHADGCAPPRGFKRVST